MSVPIHTDGSVATAGPRSALAFGERRGAVAAFLFAGVPLLVGLAIALALHLKVVLPELGTGASDVTRVIAVGELLDTPLDPGTVVFVGDSVSVEGIDARLVAEAAGPGAKVRNLAINGGNPTELTVLMPKVVAARPAKVVFTLRPRSLGEPIALDNDKASAYALGGFAKAWPSGGEPWVTWKSPGMSEAAMEHVLASEFEAQRYFRTAVVNTINNTFRSKLRKGYVPMTPSDFDSPAEMRLSLEGARLDKHISALVDEYTAAMKDGTSIGEGVVERLVAQVRAGGSTPVIVLAPLHPQLLPAVVKAHPEMAAAVASWQASLAEFAARMGKAYGAVVIDASAALDESGFADGQHPNEKGRAALSRYVGSRLGS